MPCYNGLGNLADGRPFWDAKFSQASQADLVFYYPGDGRWWLGSLQGTQFTWSSPGSTSGLGPNDPDFGQVWDGRPFWAADFDGDGRADILFHYPGDGNWWLGTFGGSPLALTWNLVGNTNNFGQVSDGRPFWVADFNGDGKADILFHYPGDGNWWLGTFGGSPLALTWNLVGNTNNFGQVWDGRPFWANDFNGDGRYDILFYYPGDGNWWLGTFLTPRSRSISWSLVSSTGRPFDQRLRLHVKIVNNNNPAVVPITTMVSNMQLLCAQASILVEWVSTENLTIQFLSDVAVPAGPPPCPADELSDEQNQLFQNRNNAELSDIVAYFVRSTVPVLNGCAAHPHLSPGAIVTARASRSWRSSNLDACLIGLEACAGAHYWARELIKLGHEVRLMING